MPEVPQDPTAGQPGADRPGNSEDARPEPTVVGIGASAGGLAAIKAFFAHVPAESGLAFVVVVHLSPEHESHLADLLQPHVKMPVRQVTDRVPLEADHVYVIPPGRNLNTIDTHLRLSPLEERRRERAPIDHFFRTLATTHDGHAVAVILTGTGSDGALGVKAVKEMGGLTVVQDPNEAEYDGMPQSAISTGLVDLVLPLAEIPEAVLGFARTEPRVRVPEREEDLEAEQRQLLHKVFAQIRARTGRDFSRYKRSTILRRIQRRMQLRQVEELVDYVAMLREEAEEVRALADDLLITVTNFFRDPAVFEALEEEVIPALFEGKGPDDDVRVWSVGCATGEEAYSLTILLLEAAGRREAPPRIQVFASDLHEHSLGKARDGFYPGDVEADVSAERLRRFFHKEDGGYRVRKEVRDLVVFAPHNLLGDPPFSKLDLVACRNVLIYLQREVQHDVVELFHYALRPEGFLLLGTSETVEGSDLFRIESKPNCLYRKRNVPAPEPRLPVFPLMRAQLPSVSPADRNEGAYEPVAYGRLHQRMVERYAPPSVLVSPDDKVVHYSQHAGRYLVHPGGVPTLNVYKLIRRELRVELRSALHAARGQAEPWRSAPVLVRFNGEAAPVVLHVRPSPDAREEGFCLIIFDEHAPEASEEEAGGADGVEAARLREADAELTMARQRLQAIIEEYETSQEELKASNEELQSANEELRSTLEELETSKEELQSMNEELQTVNQENRHKVEELAQLTGDLQNLLAATEIATLFLDRDLRILRFTPRVGELFSVRPADRGRSLADFSHRLGYPALLEDAQRVLNRLVPVEREVTDEDGRWYLARLLPYRSTEDRIEGVVLTFVEVTTLKAAERALRKREEEYRLLIESATEYAIVMLDPEGRITVWSRGAERLFGYAEAEAVGQPGALIFTAEDRAAGVPRAEQATAAQGGRAADERWHLRKDGTRFWASGVLEALRDPGGDLRGFAKVLRDNTRRKAVYDALHDAEWRQQQALEAARLGTWSFDVATGRTHFDARCQAIFGLDRAELEPDAVEALIHPDDLDAFAQARAAALDPSEPDAFEETHRIVCPDGAVRWLRGHARVFFEGDGDERRPVRAVGVVADVTEQVEAQEALREGEEKQAFLLELSDALRSLADPVEMQNVAACLLGEHLGVSRAMYAEVDGEAGDETGTLLGQYRSAEAESMTPFPERYDYSDYGERVMALRRRGETMVVADVTTDPAFSPSERAAWTTNGVRAAITVPLVKGGRFVADFGVQSTEAREWTATEIALVEETAGRTWEAVERARAEAALRESEARFRAMAETVPDAIFTVSADGAVDYVSSRLEALTGVPAREIIGVGNWLGIVHPDDRERAAAAWARAMAEEAPYEVRYRMASAEGGHSWVIARARPVRDADGTVERWFGSVTDVNALVEAEQELRELNETLEARVEERTRQVRELAASLTRSEQQERQRIARVLHDDLQQILFGLGMQLDLVGGPPALPEEAAGRLARAQELADQALSTTRSLSVELSPPVLAGAELEHTLDWLAVRSHEQHGLTVTVEVEGTPRLPDADLRVLLYQLLRELLFNVVKHAGTRAARLRAWQEGGTAFVEVSDEGAGFDIEVEKEERQDGGLGLFSIRERIHLVGGTFEVDSAPGAGTRVTISLPAPPDGPPGADGSGPSLAPATSAPQDP